MSADVAGDARREHVLAALRDALRVAERGDYAGLERALTRLDGAVSRPAFDALRRVQCELREALSGVVGQQRLAELAGRELPNARERLDFALSATEEAAHRTLDIADALRAEVARLVPLLPAPQPAVAAMQKLLSDLSEAQSFQDLTGQVIRRVVEVVARAELTLGQALASAGIPAANDSAAPAGGDGRVLSRVDRGAASQSDADDLLANLGL